MEPFYDRLSTSRFVRTRWGRRPVRRISTDYHRSSNEQYVFLLPSRWRTEWRRREIRPVFLSSRWTIWFPSRTTSFVPKLFSVSLLWIIPIDCWSKPWNLSRIKWHMSKAIDGMRAVWWSIGLQSIRRMGYISWVSIWMNSSVCRIIIVSIVLFTIQTTPPFHSINGPIEPLIPILMLF